MPRLLGPAISGRCLITLIMPSASLVQPGWARNPFVHASRILRPTRSFRLRAAWVGFPLKPAQFLPHPQRQTLLTAMQAHRSILVGASGVLITLTSLTLPAQVTPAPTPPATSGEVVELSPFTVNT